MFKIMTLLTASVFIFGSIATAQTSDKDQKSQTKASQSETLKSDTQQEKPNVDKRSAPQDLDSFFKEGERQAREGPLCEKKPEPVA